MLSSPNAGLPNSMSSVGAGQPSTPTINTSTPIDPSSMQRAYAALGLPYSSQAAGQAQPAAPGQTAGATNAQAQQTLPQPMRPVNAIGKEYLLLYKNDNHHDGIIALFINSANCSFHSLNCICSNLYNARYLTSFIPRNFK